MSFQAYLDTIKAQTGKTPQDFKVLAEKKGLLKPGVKTGEIVAWLKKDFGLGHAMAIVVTLRQATTPKISVEEGVDKHFTGGKSHWRVPYDDLLERMKKFGSDIAVSPTGSYISILRSGKKFAIVQITSDRVDIGIKRKNILATKRFLQAGAWNAMVTHRVQINNPKQIDDELMTWLHEAYSNA